MVEYEWDEAKSAVNLLKHGAAFDLAAAFDWKTACVVTDEHHSATEERFTAFGFIGDRLYVCVHTWRAGRCRIISLRKANARERKFYEKNT